MDEQINEKKQLLKTSNIEEIKFLQEMTKYELEIDCLKKALENNLKSETDS